jgi:very-short-patch-repair endonuclease
MARVSTGPPSTTACGGGPPPRTGEDFRKGQPAVLTSPIKLVKRARRLRKEMSLPEVLLWQELRKRPGGYKFRKQFPQAGFASDFACLSARLIIEIDGEVHERGDQPAFDLHKEQRLREVGFTTLRIPAKEVLADLQAVTDHIVAQCGQITMKRERG